MVFGQTLSNATSHVLPLVKCIEPLSEHCKQTVLVSELCSYVLICILDFV